MKTTICADCHGDVPVTWTSCPHCGRPALFPNVTFCQAAEERRALDARYQKAKLDAKNNGTEQIVNDFEIALAGSKAVMSLLVADVERIARSDRELAMTFYDRGKMRWDKGSNVYQGSSWNAIRPVAESAFFGDGNKDKIHFAALTLNERGLQNYGEQHGHCFVFLKESHTGHRTSTFEENMLVFLKQKGKEYWLDEEIPPGYRSTWDERAKLAIAKLTLKIETSTTPGDFAGILMVQGATTADDEFIELHMIGSMTVQTFEKVVIEQSGTKRKKPSGAKVKELKRLLDQWQVPLHIK